MGINVTRITLTALREDVINRLVANERYLIISYTVQFSLLHQWSALNAYLSDQEAYFWYSFP
jgi:hypothetical protein